MIPTDFALGFASYLRMLAIAKDETVKIKIVEDCAYQSAKAWIGNGLMRPDAVDEIHDMAVCVGLGDTLGNDRLTAIIGAALQRGEQDRDVVPPNGNGRAEPRGKSAKAKVPLPPIMSKQDFIKGFVPPNYLVDGILQMGFIYSMTGQTGHAKTAVALLIAELVGSTNPNAMLGRHRVEKGRAIYFVGENPDDVRMRIIGSDSKRSDDPLTDNISFIPGIFNVDEMIPVLEHDTKSHGPISLIVIDTSAAYFLGDEEMSNTQMASHARMLRKLTKLPGNPCTLALCHPIKHAVDATQLLPRGGGAYLAEVDGNLTLWRQDEHAILDHSGKFRGPGFQPITFKLERIEHAKGLTDAKGRSISTVHAVAITNTEEDQAEADTRAKEDRVLSAMLRLQGEDGSLAKWAEYVGWVNARGEPDKKSVENALKRLTKSKPALIRSNRGKWELTDPAGKDAARKAAIRFEAQKIAASQKDLGL